MTQQHPIDAAVRERLKTSRVNQTDIAKAIGRKEPWLNKYIHGSGHATIDDVIRIAAVLIGMGTGPLSEMERRLLQAWKKVPADSQDDALAFFENHVRFLQRGRARQSNAPKVRRREERENTKRGTP